MPTTVYVLGAGRIYIGGELVGDVVDLKLPTLFGESIVVLKGRSIGKTEVSLEEIKNDPFAYGPKAAADSPPPPRNRKPPQPKFRPKDQYQNRKRF